MENLANANYQDKLKRQKTVNKVVSSQKLEQATQRNKLTFRLPQPQIQQSHHLGEDTPYKSEDPSRLIGSINNQRRQSQRQTHNSSAISQNVPNTHTQEKQQQSLTVQQKLNKLLVPNSPKIRFSPQKQTNFHAIYNMLKTQSNINGSPSGKKGEVQYIKNDLGEYNIHRQQLSSIVNGRKSNNSGGVSRNRSIIYHAMTEKDNRSFVGGIEGVSSMKMASVNRATAAYSAYQTSQSKVKRFNEDLAAIVQATAAAPMGMQNNGILNSGYGPITSKYQIDEYLNSQTKSLARQTLKSAYSNARSKGKIVINNFYSYSSGNSISQQQNHTTSFCPSQMDSSKNNQLNNLDTTSLAKDLRSDLISRLIKLNDLQIIQSYAGITNLMKHLTAQEEDGKSCEDEIFIGNKGGASSRPKRPRSVVYSLSGQQQQQNINVSTHLKELEERLIAQAHMEQKTPPQIVQ